MNNTRSNGLDFAVAEGASPRVTLLSIPAQSAAAAFEYPIFAVPATGVAFATISRVGLVFATSQSAAATNLQTFTLRRYNAAGSLVGAVGASYVTTAAATAFTFKDITGANPFQLSAGDTLTLKDTAGGSGAATGVFTVQVEWVLEPAL